MSIAATRIHRSLTEFAATSSFNQCDTTLFFFFLPAYSGRYRRSPRVLDSYRSPVSSGDRARSAGMPTPVPLNHMEVAVHKTYSRYEMGPTSHRVSFVVGGGEPHKSVAESIPDVEEETTTSGEMGAVTYAEVEGNMETSTIGTNPQYSDVNIANA
jgi:hypothetical protein